MQLRRPFWLCRFYEPNCYMCDELEPEYAYAASKYDESDDVLFARVDGRAEPKIAEALGVTAYPVFKFYNKGSADPVRTLNKLRCLCTLNCFQRDCHLSTRSSLILVFFALLFFLKQTPFYYVHYKGRHGHTFMKKVNERLGREHHPEL